MFLYQVKITRIEKTLFSPNKLNSIEKPGFSDFDDFCLQYMPMRLLISSLAVEEGMGLERPWTWLATSLPSSGQWISRFSFGMKVHGSTPAQVSKTVVVKLWENCIGIIIFLFQDVASGQSDLKVQFSFLVSSLYLVLSLLLALRETWQRVKYVVVLLRKISYLVCPCCQALFYLATPRSYLFC